MMKNSKIKPFAEHLNEQYGKKGTPSREEYEAGFEAFRLGVIST